MKPLDGKIALITGASSGIGHALALKLAESGAKLSLVARRQAPLEQLASTIIEQGGMAIALPTDLTDVQSTQNAVEDTVGKLGPVDILVNNAGRADQGLTELLDEATLDEMILLNVKAPLRLIQQTLPSMRERGQGHIVNVVSHAAFHGFALTPAYAMAKAALHAMTLNLSYELADSPIHVTGVYPGLVDTGFAQAMTPEGGTMKELMAWMRHFRAGLRASPDFKAIEKAQRPGDVANIIKDAIIDPTTPLLFTQQVHQDAAARMIADPKWWADTSTAFYRVFVPPLRELMARFVDLQSQSR